MIITAKVAVVTGSNKGNGFTTVRAHCKQFQGDVYLTDLVDSNRHNSIWDSSRGHAEDELLWHQRRADSLYAADQSRSECIQHRQF
ncbi:uncharacterized protein LOC108166972 isoform X2 [Poecilia reticulata]|uniref:uncharacterized protein LOC108166972 isoform X2 n=1 Tax=Poecilia reticulata TaxID=8081 RepID=UPI0007EA3837|nr:PREDICTED: uncharacterized protein LOC108166972 isoform X2 [Poecilia reticulata]